MIMKFGSILVEEGVITEKDLNYAMRIQGKMEHEKSLGEVLISLSLCKRSDVKRILKAAKTRIPVGELLMENGVLSRSHLEEALEEQRQQKGLGLGEILIQKGYINERDLLVAICEHKDIPFIEPNMAMLDEALLANFSFNYLMNKTVLPLALEDGMLRVITSDMPDHETHQELETAMGFPVCYALAPKAHINATLEEFKRIKMEGARISAEYDPQKKIVELAEFFVNEAVEVGASDIHMEPLENRLRIRYRIDGVLVHRTDLPKEMESRLIARLKVLSELDIIERRRHQDGRFEFVHNGKAVDLRVSTYVTVHGENLVMRILNRQVGIVELDELGMPPRLLSNYKDFVLRAPAGVVVITGPTGSGKTTTLYSSIDAVNEIGVKIITAEDPVEYQIEGIMQCSINTKIGLTFNDTLKSIVRQDPDIIVLGEIRDKTSAETAIQAALTGHKVFTTFHTEDAVGGLLRLMNMEIETFLISSTVISVVAQRLVRKICPECKTVHKPSPKTLFLLGLNPDDLRDYTFYRGRGCEHCHNTGYKGRTAIYELLVLNEKVKDALLERRTSYYIRRISIEESGLISLQESGIAKVVKGITTFDEVLQKAPFSIRPRPVKEIFANIGEEL